MASKAPDVTALYYITHIDNVPSILRHGILSHRLVLERRLEYTPIYDKSIVSNRRERTAPGGKSLWDFANTYFQARNPMLYRVLHEKDAAEIAVLGLRPQRLSDPSALIALGNAASGATEIVPSAEGRKRLSEIWPIIQSGFWNANDGSKRKIMAECLVPGLIPADEIHTVFVANHEAAQKVKRFNLPAPVAVVPEPAMFFRPARQARITDKLFLAHGDMFFSTMQTLTVSVNVVGVMGKGLASRAKYQFPDVYVHYQDACRRRKLSMGRPYLYKRETCIDEELADEPGSLPGPNAEKWFLLFPTKRHWRDKSDLEAIQKGLQWIRNNYATEGVESLAMPALGCGLGRLDWKDVGPVMCRELAGLDIQVVIYLPRERQIPEEYVLPEYLLSLQDSKGG